MMDVFLMNKQHYNMSLYGFEIVALCFVVATIKQCTFSISDTYNYIHGTGTLMSTPCKCNVRGGTEAPEADT